MGKGKGEFSSGHTKWDDPGRSMGSRAKYCTHTCQMYIAQLRTGQSELLSRLDTSGQKKNSSSPALQGGIIQGL